ncbi:group II intron maturase-specific domain-containing protein [Streptomyces sp. NPDC085929]|uniref:group II intron maturase-specific domain-containing protein n=1 Tax=Streptomyces sp. NPDC085929 TaxID=3365739 RepID=UPI0037D6AA01
MKSWRLHRHVNSTEADIARWINPIVRGWMAYYGAFYQPRAVQCSVRLRPGPGRGWLCLSWSGSVCGPARGKRGYAITTGR